MSFNADKRRFRLEWTVDLSIDQPTEIFVPKLHYPIGFDVRVADGLGWTYHDADSVLYVFVDASNDQLPLTTVFVVVKPKANN
jgi:hypothetical protein